MDSQVVHDDDVLRHQGRDQDLGDARAEDERPFKRFVELEKSLPVVLPDAAPGLAVWVKAKVHRDALVRFQQSFYSVPFRLAGQSLWLKATDTIVTVYQDQHAVATHARQTRPGGRRTVDDHLPPAAQAWQLKDAQWCLACAEQTGSAC